MPQKPITLMDILQYQWGMDPTQLQGGAPGVGFLPNAPPAQSGPPMVNFPVGMNGETEMRPMGVPPPGLGPNPLLQYFANIGRDISGDPVGALFGAGEAFGGSVAPAGAALTEMGAMLRRGPLRGFTEAEGDAFNYARRRSDIEISRQPAHAVQGRNPDGTFRPLTEAQRVERERGIAARAANQRAADAAERRAAEEAERQAKQRAYEQSPEFQAQRQRDIDFLSNKPTQEFLDTWRRPPKKPYPPY